MDDISFHKHADEVLDQFSEDFSDIVDEHENGADYEVFFSDGVLTLQLGDAHGTFVINKQTPNKQIWLSSPFSGPKRYAYDAAADQWMYDHDDVALHKRLSEEISTALGHDYNFHVPEIF